ncbi:MAG: hypothetical protein K0Q87_101 [Neobacillus sp.]|jgi:hypothetical protein|nr:hypothetical protein [Neobacillus sp.]
MNIELLKKLADLSNQFKDLKSQFKEEGSTNIHIDGEVHVCLSELVGKENLELERRSSSEYPYKISISVEGIKIFAIATNLDLFPQFKESRKEELLKELAALEKEEEETA